MEKKFGSENLIYIPRAVTVEHMLTRTSQSHRAYSPLKYLYVQLAKAKKLIDSAKFDNWVDTGVNPFFLHTVAKDKSGIDFERPSLVFNFEAPSSEFIESVKEMLLGMPSKHFFDEKATLLYCKYQYNTQYDLWWVFQGSGVHIHAREFANINASSEEIENYEASIFARKAMKSAYIYPIEIKGRHVETIKTIQFAYDSIKERSDGARSTEDVSRLVSLAIKVVATNKSVIGDVYSLCLECQTMDYGYRALARAGFVF